MSHLREQTSKARLLPVEEKMSNKKRTRFSVLFVLLGLTFSGWLTGCNSNVPTTPLLITPSSSPALATQPKPTEAGQTIAFENLAQGDSYIAEVESPTLFVISSTSEANRLVGWLNDAEAIARIQKVDFNTTWIIAVFRGKVKSSGYGITVDAVRFTPEAVQTTVSLIEPAPDQAVSAVISYPYHLILLPREKLQVASGTTWTVYTSEGKLLAQTKYP
jgi:hypothetical protein